MRTTSDLSRVGENEDRGYDLSSSGTFPTIDDRTKRLLLRIAESHERVAKLVEQRARDAEKSK
jgi:hypothetical protein